jgi:hypothetical protein
VAGHKKLLIQKSLSAYKKVIKQALADYALLTLVMSTSSGVPMPRAGML